MSSSNKIGEDGKIDIQPLRDLARNFDIDIEPYLEEYLRLRDGHIALNEDVDDSSMPPNFAQAALKIQNSTGIYNRKVDFLHQVVYQVLNEFIQSTVAGNAAGGKKHPSNGNGNDSSIDEFHAFDSELEFLLLDDVLPVDKSSGRKKINLKSDDEGLVDIDMSSGNLDTTIATNAVGRTPDVTLLSLGGVLSASKVDQSGTFALNRESIGKTSQSAMSRMLMANLQGGNEAGKGNLRLVADRCDVGENGALLLPGTSVSVVVNGVADTNAVANASAVEIFPGGLSPVARPSINEATRDSDFGAGGNDFDQDGDGGVGFELNDDYVDNCDFDGEEKKEEGEESLLQVEEKVDDAPIPNKNIDDPWAIYDPHEPSKDKPRPLRIGKTFRLPSGLSEDDRPSASVTGSRTREKASKRMNASFLREREKIADALMRPPFLTDVTFDNTLKDENLDGERLDQSSSSIQPTTNFQFKMLKSKQLIFGDEFAYIAKAHAKHRDLLRRQQRHQQQSRENLKKDSVAEYGNAVDYGNFEDDHDDYGDHGGGLDFGAADDDGSFANASGGGENANQMVQNSNVDFDAIDDVFASSKFEENYLDGDSELSDVQQTFEELCRAHLRKFAKSAQIYAAETQLTKRVGVWQSGLVPLLEEQEKRPEFDIHSCGRRIISTVEENLATKKRTLTGEKKLDEQSRRNNIVDFETIAKDCERYEVCRRFLSTLMLCNSGNIKVHGGNNDVHGNSFQSSLCVELLDANFEAPMETFVAPSAVGSDMGKENVLPSSFGDD